MTWNACSRDIPARRRNSWLCSEKALCLFGQLEAVVRDVDEEGLRLMAIEPEDLAYQVANRVVAAFVKHQKGRAGAAEHAAQQARRAQPQDLFQTGYERGAIRLVKAVFECGREG